MSKEKDEALFEFSRREIGIIEMCLHYHTYLESFGAPNHVLMEVIAKLASPWFRAADGAVGIDSAYILPDDPYDAGERVVEFEYCHHDYHSRRMTISVAGVMEGDKVKVKKYNPEGWGSPSK